MPAANVIVSATFLTKNEPGTYKDTPLTRDMYKGWDDVDDYAKVNNDNRFRNPNAHNTGYSILLQEEHPNLQNALLHK